MDGEIRILILEDNPIDAELADYTLKAAGLNFISKVVETEGEYRSALNEFSPDLILSDYDLPTFNGADALSIVKEIRPDLPFILYTGALGEERAIEILTGGATDYVMKNRLSRLVPAVERALKEAEEHRKRRTAEVERDLLLQQLEARVQERTAQLQDEITERKRAEAEKARLATFPTLNPNPITEFDDAGQVYYLNPSAEQLFPELRSRGLEHPWLRDWKKIVDDLRKSGDKGSVREVNVGESWYQQTIHVVKDPRRIRLYGIDITKRKRSEEALKESEERWLTTLASIGDAVIATDHESKISFMNAIAEKVTGWSICEVKSEPVTKVFNIINEHTRRKVENPVERVLREGNIVGLANHTILIRKDGAEVPIDDSGAPIKNKAGRITGVVLVFRDVTESKQAQDALKESEKRVRAKLENILSPDGDIGNLDLADIIDIPAIQSFMDDFYHLAQIPMTITDLNGKFLVGVGWQDVCTKFHRLNPDTCKHCIESDTQLSADINPGEFRLYKCKNNMWDIATPLMIGGLHVGHVFSGQFFFEDEPLDYDLFRSQARQYGFDEDDYISALKAVPRLSRGTLDKAMNFFIKLAEMISKLSYGNVKLARALAQQDALTASVNESREDLNRAQAVAKTGSWHLDISCNELLWSDEAYRIFGVPKGTPMTYEAFLAIVHPDDREYVDRKWDAAMKGEKYDIEHRIIIGSEIKWVRERAELDFDSNGTLEAGFGTVQDITERKWGEEALQKAKDELEDKVLMRTAQLTMTNDSLLAEIEGHRRTEERLRSVRKMLRAMASEIVIADERTRQHLAADLHDTVVQTLGVAKLRSQFIQELIPPEALQIYSEVQNMLSEAITQARLIMAEMSPPVLNELGFLPALEWLTEQIETRHGISIKFTAANGSQQLGHEIQVLLFQATREILMNVVKHSKAESAIVKFSSNNNRVRIEVTDNGTGFDKKQAFRPDTSSGGFGLFSIRERLRHLGGQLFIKSESGKGTSVVMTVPRSMEK